MISKANLISKKVLAAGKEVTVFFLDTILCLTENFTKIVDRRAVYSALNGNFEEQQWTVSEISRYIHSLKQRGYVEIDKVPKGESIKFTTKGKIKVLETFSEKSERDGNFRFLSFDIPESFKLKRNQFRRSIKRLGFKQVQKSLWVCDRNVGDLVDLLIGEYDLKQYVAYIISASSDIDDYLKDQFK
ncbi:MAG TPA: hypothetical protein PK263_03040 [bacterium]|nr:hypothetical protein [bacterium]